MITECRAARALATGAAALTLAACSAGITSASPSQAPATSASRHPTPRPARTAASSPSPSLTANTARVAGLGAFPLPSGAQVGANLACGKGDIIEAGPVTPAATAAFYTSALPRAVEADQATVDQYTALVSFERVYAPFDGVITARNTDIGDLINSGSSANVKTDLFHVAQPGTLRVYVNVPEEYSRGIKVGMTSELSLAEFPDRKFQGKVMRTAEAINVTTRTLLIEIDVNNPSGTLLTGSYAEVHLAVPTPASTFLIPVNTLIFRSEGLRVGVVKDGKVVLTAVTPGHDFGNQIEIVSGLKSDDQIIINPPDSIIHGQAVQIVQATLPGDMK